MSRAPGDQLVRGRGVLGVAALGEQAQLQRARPMKLMSPAALQPVRERLGSSSACSRRAELGEEGTLMAAIASANSAMPRRSQKSIPSRQGGEGGLRPLVAASGDGEVVVQDGGLAALALLERELERAAHVLESLPLAQVAAGEAAEAERARRLGQAELGGERERPLGGRDRLRVGGAEEAVRRQLQRRRRRAPGQAAAPRAARAPRRALVAARVAQATEHVRERRQHPAGGYGLALSR